MREGKEVLAELMKHQCSPLGAATHRDRGASLGDTHGDTRWRPRQCREPRAGPGRRAGSARSRCRPCCAGTRRPGAQPRPARTRWRGHCICTCSKTPARGAAALSTGVGSSRQRDDAQAVQCAAPLQGWLPWGGHGARSGAESSSGCAGIKAACHVPEALPA